MPSRMTTLTLSPESPPMGMTLPTFQMFSPPYRHVELVENLETQLMEADHARGSALIWSLDGPPTGNQFELIRCRPPGMALVVVLPDADTPELDPAVLHLVHFARPHSVLPHHSELNVFDLRAILSRISPDIASEVTDYLTWRHLVIDLETRRMIRKIIELSNELRTVSGLARTLYLSRRALGRRFMCRGLPVPSHWLHFSRLLHATLRLQNSDSTLLTVASEFGYPDGFSLSNQMNRLVGVRPTTARDYLGWEWFLEAWIQRELSGGGFSPANTEILEAWTSEPVGRPVTQRPPSKTRPRKKRRLSGSAEATDADD